MKSKSNALLLWMEKRLKTKEEDNKPKITIDVGGVQPLKPLEGVFDRGREAPISPEKTLGLLKFLPQKGGQKRSKDKKRCELQSKAHTTNSTLLPKFKKKN